MRKVIAYLACSLNGKIARKNGSVDWLHDMDKLGKVDYGFHDFYATVDTTIMGASTYRWILDMGVEFPYKDKENFVFTRNNVFEDHPLVNIIDKDHLKLVEDLKHKEGKDIWLVGGGQLKTLFLNEGLLDELCIHQMPVILPDGIDVFENTPKENMASLIKSRSFENGAIEMVFRINKS